MPAAKPLSIVLTSAGAPGTAALVRALRRSGGARVVGADLRADAIGSELCDAFATVPPSADRGYAAAVLALACDQGATVVIPQASADLPGLAAARGDFADAGVAAIVSSPEAVACADSKLVTMACAAEAGVHVPQHRIAVGGDALVAAARELGYPERDVCMKPVVAAGSRGFHVLSARIDRRAQLLTARPGPAPLALEDAAEALGDDPTELLVMELATGLERTVDGFARDGEVLFAHAKTREEMRAGLAMRFVTLDDPALVAAACAVVGSLGLDGFFNVQFIGDALLEVNPRISTIVYQDDLDLAWLGVRAALGDLDRAEADAAMVRLRPGRVAIRYFDQVERDPG